MKALDRFITKFCYNHPRFGIKNLMLYVVIGNVAVFFLSMMDTTGTLWSYLCFSPRLILRGQIWRLVTFVFIPPTTSLFSMVISLYFYYFIGTSLEAQWGQARFNIYYFTGVVLAWIYGFISELMGVPAEFVVSTYYVNMSMFLAYATLWPDATVLLFFIIPIKMKWLALLDVAIFVVGMIRGATLFPLVGILNYLIFCGPALCDMVFGTRRRTARTVQFKSAVKKAQKAEKERNYRHKCAVCGRTDTDHPELEFR